MNIIDIIIFDEEELTKTLAESYAGELTFPCRLVKKADTDITGLQTENSSKIILFNISAASQEIFEKIKLLCSNKNIKIAAISNEGSANMQVKAFRAGVCDFLIKPLIKEDFIRSMQSIYKKYFFRQDINTQSKIYTAVSEKSGSGKSNFLINLAEEIADISEEKVLLLDFNTSQDRISSLLNADIIHNTGYYINNLTEDNAQAILADVFRYKNSTLYIMAENYTGKKQTAVKKDRLNTAVSILKQHFKYIFIDKTPDDAVEDEILINTADEIFCLVLPEISSFDKIKKIIDTHSKDKNIRIILNQYTMEDASKIEQIQSMLGCGIFWKIPKNYTALNKAASMNAPLKEAAEGTDIANTYLELAKYLVNRN